MKKFASLLLTVLLLCTLCIPAFAEDAPTEIVPFFSNPNIPGSLDIITNGNYIISKDYVLNNIMMTTTGATLTIAKGVTVTVNQDLGNFGTLNVCGTLILSDNFYNYMNSGTINVFACCGGKILGSFPTNKNPGTIFTQDEHNFADGKCSCGTYECEVTGNHKLENGVCSICNKYGCEIGILNHNFVNGVCSVCNVKGYEIGELDHSFVNGVCSVCEYECEHDWDAATGKCSVCQYECQHDGNTCVVCGANIHGGEVDADLGLGSTLSEGNLTIIVGIAGVAVGMAAMFFIMKKKKPALADAEDKDE